ncbi:hypothetical protein KPH14_011715 [Odynerus spinipes]|uniref:Uncharacterized protein n=1 Tax=Odynerus spinipes TaxID=1348599 RepID=A0AAD9RVH0_9HYME|nr:hypothetical protein KPH14_011715 [Odynerus spinipes]
MFNERRIESPGPFGQIARRGSSRIVQFAKNSKYSRIIFRIEALAADSSMARSMSPRRFDFTTSLSHEIAFADTKGELHPSGNTLRVSLIPEVRGKSYGKIASPTRVISWLAKCSRRVLLTVKFVYAGTLQE